MTETCQREIELRQEIEQLRSQLDHIYKKTKKHAAQLYESEERFALAMRNASDGLWDWNLSTDEVYYSPCWKKMLGYEESELAHHLDVWKTLVHSDDKDLVLDGVQDYLSGKRDSFEVELRLRHKDGHDVYVRSRAFKVTDSKTDEPIRLVGTNVDITRQKKAEAFNKRNTKILEMIAKGKLATDVYNEIASMYEEYLPGIRCSMLQLNGTRLLHGGAPSLPKKYCKAMNGLEIGPSVGSCGTAIFTGKRVLVEDISVDIKWDKLKELALPHGMRCCWSEPIISSFGKVLGAFGMYRNYPAMPTVEESHALKSAAQLTSIVMEREQNHKRIQDLAYTDELTKLSNRTHFYLSIEKLIKKSARKNRKFGLLYIDLDEFKNVNDSLGHNAGDILLKNVALRLNQACRDVDFIARLSGDEFTLVVNDVEDEFAAVNVAKRCLSLIAEPMLLEGRTIIPTCSIGIAHYPTDGADLQTILKSADAALYSAKNYGRNQYAFYNEELTRKANYRFKVEQYLREAIDRQQLALVYQPKIDIKTGDITSVEALSRWFHPDLGHVSPDDFIMVAEQIGMIKPLTEWVLKTACHQAVLWKKCTGSAIRMAVNISPSHFLDPDFVPFIERIINETGMEPCDLELEITEGTEQTKPENLCIFEQLKALGILLSIDDFGTGYSSFASLKHLNVDFLKIDKYFIDDIITDEKSQHLINSMIKMGHHLGHQVIAEGIEDAEQFKMLKELGCDGAQGYFFSKPASAEKLSKIFSCT